MWHIRVEQLFLTVGQNNFGNKIPFLCKINGDKKRNDTGIISVCTGILKLLSQAGAFDDDKKLSKPSFRGFNSVFLRIYMIGSSDGFTKFYSTNSQFFLTKFSVLFL